MIIKKFLLSLSILLCLLTIVAISWLFSFLIGVCFLIWCWNSRNIRYIAIVVVLISAFRGFLFFEMYNNNVSNPNVDDSSRSIHRKLPLVLIQGDLGFIESIIQNRISLMNSNIKRIISEGESPEGIVDIWGQELIVIKDSSGITGVYSIGIDGLDDGLGTIYDSSNGTVSRGNIRIYP